MATSAHWGHVNARDSVSRETRYNALFNVGGRRTKAEEIRHEKNLENASCNPVKWFGSCNERKDETFFEPKGHKIGHRIIQSDALFGLD